MIPKIIHYCWLSKDKKPENVLNCIESWNKTLPGWKIKCWDSSSFNFDSVPYVKEAYSSKKWAFVSDYLRLYALYTEGGIYLDSDVQVWGDFSDWLEYDFFTGLEMRDKEHTEIYPEAAIMGSVPGHPIIEKALHIYDEKHFLLDDGSLDTTPIPTTMKPLFLSMGWKPEDTTQVLEDNAIVLSTDYIANTNCERKSSVKLYHLNNRSWIPLSRKEKLIRLIDKLGLLSVLKTVCRK